MRSACAGIVLAASGCGAPRFFARPDGAGRSVTAEVGASLADVARRRSGESRWTSLTNTRHQSREDLARYLELDPRVAGVSERLQAALAQRPLYLEECMFACLECNDAVQARRADVKRVGGDALVARSRFLPRLAYLLETTRREADGEPTEDDSRSTFRLSQTVLEFGKDSSVDVDLREAERRALFSYEDAVRDALAGTRRTFFTVLLRKRQLEERRKLLEEFQERHRKMEAMEEARRVLEADVLTARLNVLNEEARINALEKEILRKKIELLRLLGLRADTGPVRISGDLRPFEPGLDKAVALALRRSTDVAQAKLEVAEQQRRARQVRWEFLPDVDLKAAWKEEASAFGLNLAGNDGAYELASFAETHPDVATNGFVTEYSLAGSDEEGWFLGLELELPIFEGLGRYGRLRRETALFEKAVHELRGIVGDIETSVGKAYHTLAEERKDLEIKRETVEISRKRLRVLERLKELGKATDNELETFRTRFFSDQDAYFEQQIRVIDAQETLRARMRYFEPAEGE
jgi:outer membrane protein TolC